MSERLIVETIVISERPFKPGLVNVGDFFGEYLCVEQKHTSSPTGRIHSFVSKFIGPSMKIHDSFAYDLPKG